MPSRMVTFGNHHPISLPWVAGCLLLVLVDLYPW